MLAAFLPLLLTIALAAAFFYVVFAADLKPRHMVPLALAVMGGIAVVSGFRLAVLEEWRNENGGSSELQGTLGQIAVGVALLGLAVIVKRFADPARRRLPLSAAAVVTAVTPIDPHGRPRWNVQFTYLDDEGIAHEASQEFMRDAWKPGDEAIAEYDKDRPQEAVLIPVPLVAADADRARRDRH